MTPKRPSELPRVLIVATIGFSNQILANLRLRSMLMLPPTRDRKMTTISQPVMISATAKTTFPNENQPLFGQVVGRSIHASKGV